jgi:membrane complex biogenesis BtpA family protein
MKRVDLGAVFESVHSPLVVGMVHLQPLPGSPGWEGSVEHVIERACADAEALSQGGVDGALVENFGDAPFFADSVGAETIAALTRVATEVTRVLSVPLGVNVLRNDGLAAVAIATATGARFVRVNVLSGTMATDQGWIRGRAGELLRFREALGSRVAILADVFVKHATPPAGLSLSAAASDTWHRGGADALIVSGRGTGSPTKPEHLEAIANVLPDTPLWVGSGATAESVRSLSELANGIIVGSAIQLNGKAGQAVDPTRLQRFMEAAR